MVNASQVAANIEQVRRAVHQSCARSQRNTDDIALVAVSKTLPPEAIEAAYDLGLRHFAENYVQEALPKIAALAKLDITWHYIGRIQSNKLKLVVEAFSVLHSMDGFAHWHKLAELCQQAQKSMQVLWQINMAEEPSKGGLAPELFPELLKRCEDSQWLKSVGLMTFPPWCEDPELNRQYFSGLKHLLQQVNQERSAQQQLSQLSMGVSSDYPVAIEEGATWIRLGTSLFGSRSS